jgi:hypothetical protein
MVEEQKQRSVIKMLCEAFLSAKKKIPYSIFFFRIDEKSIKSSRAAG